MQLSDTGRQWAGPGFGVATRAYGTVDIDAGHLVSGFSAGSFYPHANAQLS